ncbi:MAG: NUDIX domain-containing protein [Acidimicrobiia bacterium]
MGDYRLLSSAVVARGGFLDLAEEHFVNPRGEEFVRYAVHHPGAVVAVALEGEAALLVRQWRGAVRRHLLEAPAGKLDVPGEEPADAMRRELAEEIGRAPGSLVKLAEFYNSPGFTDELTHVYLATDLSPSASVEALKDEEEDMTVESVPLRDFDRLIASGLIVDAKTIIALLLARARLAVWGDG